MKLKMKNIKNIRDIRMYHCNMLLLLFCFGVSDDGGGGSGRHIALLAD